MSECKIDGCSKAVHARGWCRKHYCRWQAHGDPLTVLPTGRKSTATPEQRFWAKVDKRGPVPTHRPSLGPCWLWTGTQRREGYGKFGVSQSDTRTAHRFGYELAHGPIPDDLTLDPLCRVHACVRPSHLEPVTHRENILRGEGLAAINATKTHCLRGHEFTPANTRHRRSVKGRECLTCERMRKAARNAR